MATRRQDKAEEGRGFFRRIAAEGVYARIFLLYGEERYLVEQGLKRLLQAAFPDGRDDFNFISYHGTEARASDILSGACQVPMFATQRVVVVRGIEHLSASELGPIADYSDDPVDSTLLILEATKLDGRQRAIKKLVGAKSVQAIEFAPLRDREVIGWVARQARKRKLELESDVAAYLVDTIGSALGPLDQALERIELYLEDTQAASLEDVRALVPDSRTRSVSRHLWWPAIMPAHKRWKKPWQHG